MISSIRLTNFLSFRDISLSLEPLTVLTGTNSSGKSSLLHSVAILRQSSDSKTLPDALLLNGELVEVGTGRDLLHAEPALFDQYDKVVIGIEITSRGRRSKWISNYVPEADVLDLHDHSGHSSLDDLSLFSPGFQYLAADRIVPAVTFPKSHTATAVKRWLGRHGEHTPNYLRVHGGAPSSCITARHDSAASDGLLDQTNAWLRQLSPGTSLGVDDVPGTDYVRLSFTRSGPTISTEAHRSTNVGFGLTYALPVLVACLSAPPGSLLLVENPEAHLHPSGQAIMGNLCAAAAASGVQVVVETHSDHVLNAIRLAIKRQQLPPESAVIHFFSRREGVIQPDVETISVSVDGMLPHWPTGFFDQWDQDLDNLLG